MALRSAAMAGLGFLGVLGALGGALGALGQRPLYYNANGQRYTIPAAGPGGASSGGLSPLQQLYLRQALMPPLTGGSLGPQWQQMNMRRALLSLGGGGLGGGPVGLPQQMTLADVYRLLGLPAALYGGGPGNSLSSLGDDFSGP
jgi:hypothetical protein